MISQHLPWFYANLLQIYSYLASSIFQILAQAYYFQLCILSSPYLAELNKVPYDMQHQYNIMQSEQGNLKHFQVIKKVGQGAFGQVYQVRRRVDNQTYALKKVRMTGMKEKEKENALNQIRILASLNDDYIIKFKEAFYDNLSGYLCIVMEFASGGDLMRIINQNLKAKTRVKQAEIWKALVNITRGLKSLHDKKILHRDLKAANIFISSQGVYKLGDLNVSKVLKKGLAYTQTGTPYYASPEVWQDLPYDMKSDIWSLGCVIYQMAALEPPFKATDLQSLYKKVKAGVFKPIPNCYSSDLSQMVNSMLKLRPKERPNTDEILKNPATNRHFSGSNQSEVNHYQQPLLNTIKFNPFNLNALKGRLPKAAYENEGGKSHRQSIDNLNRQRVYSACGTRKAYQYSPQPMKKEPEKEKPNISIPHPPKPSLLPPKPTPRRTEDKNQSRQSGVRLRRVGQQILDSGRHQRSSSVQR